MRTDQARVKPIHPLEIRLGIAIGDAQPRRSPLTVKVDAQGRAVRKRVLYPFRPATVLHDDDQLPMFRQVTDRNSPSPS